MQYHSLLITIEYTCTPQMFKRLYVKVIEIEIEMYRNIQYMEAKRKLPSTSAGNPIELTGVEENEVAKRRLPVTSAANPIYLTGGACLNQKDRKERLEDITCIVPKDTDGSLNGVGAVLSQIQDDKEKVISYASRTLSKSHRNYCYKTGTVSRSYFCKTTYTLLMGTQIFDSYRPCLAYMAKKLQRS
ncbi:unnamed protein product [Mytilus coruscus]|uniref:Reverse transcriptase/retrotransposon-derived protein RNase H-like domain-containing protein n=1 Tax=Mytilus coruscus TaxID=42192 RepID=A0A6J8BVV3_MYTCO|nr:unnamed protein product [Mytilus coruscus]